MEGLNIISITVIEDLRKDIKELLNVGSNIELIWKLEKLHNEKAFLKSANLIRKSIK